jgi:RNA polymerase sigma factor (sigma-70 family)
VSNFEYTFAHINDPYVVCETLSSQRYRQAGRLNDWPDNELEYIRATLHRVASLRILNTDDVEDIVQETLLTMTLKYPKEKLEKGLLIWSMGILRRKVGNYYRRSQRHISFDENILPGYGHKSGINKAMSPEEGARHSELRHLVDSMLTRLQPSERRVLNMHLDGMPAGDIAGELHPEKYQNVINRIHRGRAKLAKELVKFGYGNGKTVKKRSR